MSHSMFFPRSGLLAVALAGSALLSFPASAGITIQAGSATYSCTLGSLSVSSTGDVSANVSACSPSLADAGGTDTGGTGGTDTGGTGGGDSGAVGADGDPRTGLWSPGLKDGNVVYVADQSLDKGTATTVSRLPGCINGGSIDNTSACTSKTSYSGTVNGQPVSVKLTAGQILSIRFIPSGAAQAALSGTLALTNSVGGSVGINTQMSLSTTPGDMNPTNPKCVVTSSRTPAIGLGSSYCPVTETGKVYYLNIKPLSTCSTCNWRLEESSTLTVFKR